jgi:hypothetical protein
MIEISKILHKLPIPAGIELSMIFDQAQCVVEKQDRSSERNSQLGRLFAVFEASFPPVQYRLLDSVTAINAQASSTNGSCLVDVFGGLAFHPAIGHDGLVFMLLHETGHHLSKGCKLPYAPLACECAADAWAADEGRRNLRANGEDYRLPVALQEIENAVPLQTRGVSSASAPRASCWAMNWRERRQALLEGRTMRLKTCQISRAITRLQSGEQYGRTDS